MLLPPHPPRRFDFVRSILPLLFLFSCLRAPAEVIYDNSSHFLNRVFDEKREYGDQMDLEGTARQLTDILFEYFGKFEVDGDEHVKVRLYTNETQYDLYRKKPTALLFESDWMPIRPGYNTHAISGLNVTLPLHTVTLTVEFAGIAENESVGLLFYDPPTVGYSFNEIWLRGALGDFVPVLYSSEPTHRASAGIRLIAQTNPLLDQRSSGPALQVAMQSSSNQFHLAQTFSPMVSGRLNDVTVTVQFTNQPVLVRILDTLGDAPGPNVLGSLSILNGSATPQTVTFVDKGIYLEAGRRYAIELSTAADSTTVPSYFLGASTNSYEGGRLWQREKTGGFWVPVTTGSASVLNANFETHILAAEPDVRIVSPLPDITFDFREPIWIEAKHRPPEIGTIARVRFLDGVREIGVVTNAPFKFVWPDAEPGEHQLRAVAEDTFRRPFRSTTVRVFVRPAGSPVNDSFSRRATLPGMAARSIKPISSATIEPLAPKPFPSYGGPTLWWSWTAYDHSPVTISTRNSIEPDAGVAVYRGDSLTNLVPVSVGVTSTVFVPEAGVTYAILVQPKSNGDFLTVDLAAADVRVGRVSPVTPRAGEMVTVQLTGSPFRAITNAQLFADGELLASTNSVPFEFRSTFPGGYYNFVVVSTDDRGLQTVSSPFPMIVRPSNDSPAEAPALSGFADTVEFSSDGATGEPLDPPGIGLDAHSIWYKWRAPANGIARLTIENRDAGGVLLVYRSDGDRSSFLEPVAMTPITIGEDLEFYATAEENYLFLINADHHESGRLTVRLRPANDLFTERGHLDGQLAHQNFWLFGGGMELNEPLPLSIGTNPSTLWWTWTSPVSGAVRLELNDSNPADIAIFTGDDLTTLHLVNQATNSLEFTAEEGTTYQVRIAGGQATNTAELTLTLNVPRLDRPVNNQIFEAPARIPLRAIFPGSAQILAFEFFANGNLITNLEHSATGLLWTNVPQGVYELRARTRTVSPAATAPVWIYVTTNRHSFTPQLFAGAFSRATFVANESGEVRAFGKIKALRESLEHHDSFYPAVLNSVGNAHGWQSIEANQDGVVGLTGSGLLFTNNDLFGGTGRWTHVATDGAGRVIAIGPDRELYLGGTNQVQRPSSVSGWVAIALSSTWGLGLADSGDVYLIRNDNALVEAILPRPPGINRWIDVAAGNDYALLQGNNGELYSVSLAAAASTNILAPTLITRPVGISAWTAFKAGGDHQLFLAGNGALYAAGRNVEGQLGIGNASIAESMISVPFPRGVSRWTQIAAGARHSVALGDDCHVYTWGSNAEGQLGAGRHVPFLDRPVRVESLGSLCVSPPRIEAITRLATGDLAVRFNTVLNKATFVEYSTDLVNWRRAVHEIAADGLELEFLDAGAPVTIKHPRDETTRFYRVVFE